MHIKGSRILDTCGDISPFDYFQLKTESEDPDWIGFFLLLLSPNFTNTEIMKLSFSRVLPENG